MHNTPFTQYNAQKYVQNVVNNIYVLSNVGIRSMNYDFQTINKLKV